jgi:succinate dehydrogenase / fumarate reductase iron-sulfur subunit
MQFHLRVWRQAREEKKGRLVEYDVHDISPEMSFLEMMDELNRQLISDDSDPVAFDHDCREGICGACSMMINGQAHGPSDRGQTEVTTGATTCQLYMRDFEDDTTIVIEPFRARAFPLIKDLVIDRSAFDEIIAAGGFVSVNTGNAQDANDILISKQHSDLAMDAASCIGCGACVAACRNASAMLFVGAKVSHLSLLPQGAIEKNRRVLSMVSKMDELGFGNCSNEMECEAACPKDISVENIARMNRQYLMASVIYRDDLD